LPWPPPLPGAVGPPLPPLAGLPPLPPLVAVPRALPAPPGGGAHPGPTSGAGPIGDTPPRDTPPGGAQPAPCVETDGGSDDPGTPGTPGAPGALTVDSDDRGGARRSSTSDSTGRSSGAFARQAAMAATSGSGTPPRSGSSLMIL